MCRRTEGHGLAPPACTVWNSAANVEIEQQRATGDVATAAKRQRPMRGVRARPPDDLRTDRTPAQRNKKVHQVPLVWIALLRLPRAADPER